MKLWSRALYAPTCKIVWVGCTCGRFSPPHTHTHTRTHARTHTQERTCTHEHTRTRARTYARTHIVNETTHKFVRHYSGCRCAGKHVAASRTRRRVRGCCWRSTGPFSCLCCCGASNPLCLQPCYGRVPYTISCTWSCLTALLNLYVLPAVTHSSWLDPPVGGYYAWATPLIMATARSNTLKQV